MVSFLSLVSFLSVLSLDSMLSFLSAEPESGSERGVDTRVKGEVCADWGTAKGFGCATFRGGVEWR